MTAPHYELDGCCGFCGPCFRPEGSNRVKGLSCEGWPCPSVLAREQVESWTALSDASTSSDPPSSTGTKGDS